MNILRFPHPRIELAAIVLSAGVLAGCAGGPQPAPSPLPELSGPKVEGEVIWRTNAGAGAGDHVTGFELAVDGRYVYTAHRNGKVAALKLEDGRTAWRVDTNLRLVSGPTVADGRLLLGTRDGQVVALSAEDGSQQWRAEVSSEVLAAPAAGDGTVIVRTLDGQLMALEMDSGARRWTVERSVPTLTLRGTSSPVILGDTVFAGLDNGKVLALNLDNGEQRWEQRVAAPTGRTELERVVDIDAALLLVENELYAASAGGRLASLSRTSGRVRWNREVGSRTGLAFDRERVFVTDLDGGVRAFSRAGGTTEWHQEALAYRELARPVMYRGHVTVADFEGYLHWLSPEDGAVLGRFRPMKKRVRATPVVVGDRILVLGVDGTVTALEAAFPKQDK